MNLGPYYYWASLAYHQASSFGRFPEPSTAEPLARSADRAPPSAPSRLEPRLSDLLGRRSSRRDFGEKSLDGEAMRDLLWAGYGCLEAAGTERRTVPSAGGTYALRLLLVAQSVDGLSRGAYAFNEAGGQLDPMAGASLPADLSVWFRTKHVDYAKVGAVVLIAVRFGRVCERYGERGYRYALLEAGHVGQNLCLAATSLDIPHVPIGGFEDDAVNRGLLLKPDESAVVYSIVLGMT